jgi:phage gpG-like protein
LGRSIKKQIEPGKVTIFSDVPYAAAHNEGTNNAGRKRNVVIPKRQFIGDSETLNKEIEKIIADEIGKILKQ